MRGTVIHQRETKRGYPGVGAADRALTVIALPFEESIDEL
jgi:hypothetical protein